MSFQILDFKKTILASAISVIITQNSDATVYNVTENLDDGTGLIENSLSWAILQSNENPGDDEIVLNTSIRLTGVMKRLINSDIELKSDGLTRTIDGDEQFRPLFIKSGQVMIKNIEITKGNARGGAASGEGGGGAGMGGGIFIYSGNVHILDTQIQSSTASTFTTNFSRSGGGMYGSGSTNSGGGLFESGSANGQAYGGYGNYNNVVSDFGLGGGNFFNNKDGGFGAGGGYRQGGIGGLGGFGAGGGYCLNGDGGDGGFGGGAGDTSYGLSGTPGYGAYEGYGASLGGGIFIRSGNLQLENVDFDFNLALGNNGAKGLGGALFIMHTTSHMNGNNQGMPFVLPQVTACNVSFIGNGATSDPGTPNNNNDIFDLADIYTDLNCISDLIFKSNFEDAIN